MARSSVFAHSEKVPQCAIENIPGPKPPVHFAFVHLNKPIDMALVGQIVLATNQMKVTTIGRGLDFGHPKVVAKMRSWNIDNPYELLKDKSHRCNSILELRLQNPSARLVGTLPAGGANPFEFSWYDNDIIVIGGANGLSREDISHLDDAVTIPMAAPVEFLTVGIVVAALGYHVLTYRGSQNIARQP